MRVNLDATLRLVDQENLAKSELLTATLRPHGNGPRKRPIFPGSNDRAYQVLSTWVQSLRSPKDLREAARTQPGRSQRDDVETFAAGRGRIGNDDPEDGPSSPSSGGREHVADGPTAARIPRPTPFASGPAMKPEGAIPGAPDDFPLPFVITGKKPNLASPNAAARPGSNASRTGDSASPPTGGTVGKMPGSLADADNKTGDQAKPGDPATPKKKAKPVKLDPAVLERAPPAPKRWSLSRTA